VNSDHWEDAASGLRQALPLIPVAAQERPTGELPRTSQLRKLDTWQRAFIRSTGISPEMYRMAEGLA
jgi:hypothetical protein